MRGRGKDKEPVLNSGEPPFPALLDRRDETAEMVLILDASRMCRLIDELLWVQWMHRTGCL